MLSVFLGNLFLSLDYAIEPHLLMKSTHTVRCMFVILFIFLLQVATYSSGDLDFTAVLER